MPQVFLELLPDGLDRPTALAQCLQCLGSPDNGTVLIMSSQTSLQDMDAWLAAAEPLGLHLSPNIEVAGSQAPSVALVAPMLDAYAALADKYISASPWVYVDNYRKLPDIDWAGLLPGYSQFLFCGNLGIPFTSNTATMPPIPDMAPGFHSWYTGLPAGKFTKQLLDQVPGCAVGVWAGVDRVGTPEYLDARFTAEYRETWETALANKASVHIVAYDPGENRIILGNPALMDLTAYYASRLAGKPFPFTSPRGYVTTATPAKPNQEQLTVSGSGLTALMTPINSLVPAHPNGTRFTYESVRTA